MNDFKDEQRPNGVLPCIIPTSVWGYDWANGVDWTSAVAIIPWEVYLFMEMIVYFEICIITSNPMSITLYLSVPTN